MRKVYILEAKRTAIGTFSGTLQDTSTLEMGTTLAKNMLANSAVQAKNVNEVIFGNVLSAGLGQNISRQIAIKSGIPQEVPAFTVNKVCASGMKALELGYQSIVMGNAEVVLAGGVENMNMAPYLAKGVRFGLRMNNATLEDSMVNDGLWCSINNYHMGITAENLAEKYQISRQAQDEFALRSHHRAAKAIEAGIFADEIVPVPVKQKKETIAFKVDEHCRPDTTLDKLAKLRPAFKKDGSVTAGNSSGINDGAAAMILAGEEYVKQHKLQPLAEIIAFSSAAVDPSIMGIGPAPTVKKLLEKTGVKLVDVQLFELNEAFASQSLAVLQELKIDTELVNVNGGAIALGHPIGASGARIGVTLLHEMKRRKLTLGLASLCVGGGMGMAMLVKM